MRHLVIFIYCNLLFVQVFAQIPVKGKVMDKNHLAIPFATISVINGEATICDSLGEFMLQSCSYDSEYVLIIQSMGYIPDTIRICNKPSGLNVYLDKKLIPLQEIVVSARQSIESKSSVSAFTTYKNEIEQLNPRNVNQILQTKSGFTNRTGYQTPLNLRGLSGKRLLILRNGNRRFSSYPAGVMSHTINVYDLERIEVEKGASSVIYGAGAIAGVIHLIDKSPFKQAGLNSKITTGYGTGNQEKNLLACGGWSNGKFGIKAGMRYRSANNFSYSDGSEAENSFYTDKDLFITSGYQICDGQTLALNIDMHNGGPWGKPVGFNGSDYMQVGTKNEKSNNYSLKYNSGIFIIFDDIEWSIFYSNENRELVKKYFTAADYSLSYIETTYFSDYYYGSNIKTEIRLNKYFHMITGAEIYSFHISTPTSVTDYIEGFSYQNRISKNARSHTGGIYMQNDFRINPKVKLTTGIRYDKAIVFQGEIYDLDQDNEKTSYKEAVSYNMAAQFKPNTNHTVKLNISRSFRMPETTELYTDNYTSNGIIYGNAELQPEYCYSFDAIYILRKGIFSVELSPFLWLMNNMVTKEEIFGMPGTNYTYLNIGKTRLFGEETTFELSFKNTINKDDKLIISSGIAYLNGTDVTESADYLSKGTPLDYIPPFNLKSGISYHYSFGENLNVTLALHSVYYSEQKRLGDNPYATPAFASWDARVRINFPAIRTKPSVNISVNNLTNKEYYCYQSYLPCEGRDIRLFITFYL